MSELNTRHRKALEGSAISPEVIEARGYRSMGKPYNDANRELFELGIPPWARREDRYLDGLLIPLYRPTGEQVSHQYRPDRTPKVGGKERRYAAAKGRASVVDINPINTVRVKDPEVPLWVTEGVKKADALTSAGLCAVALSGVYNWRDRLGALGDWEDIPLKDRLVYIVFDSDAAKNPNVARAMARFGAWLRSKGARTVLYIVVPCEVPTAGPPVKLPDGSSHGTAIPLDKVGADDFLAHGGTVAHLEAAATPTAPKPVQVGDTFTDARLAETIAADVLVDRFCWTSALNWLEWDGQRWREVPDKTPVDEIRKYVLDRFAQAVKANDRDAIDGWYKVTTAARMRSVLGLAAGVEGVLRDAADFDAHPDLLNTPTGVVDLTTGDLLPADADLLMTKMTGVGYRPGAVHEDWTAALEAVPEDVRPWLQVRYGQAVTGHAVPDDRLIVQQGSGENGKSTLTAGVAGALGDYYLLVSDRVLLANPDSHPTELMDLRGTRLAMIEETPEERRLSVARLKKVVGTPQITARHIRKDSVTFDATHSLFLSTNYIPTVQETDHGTWRRLELVKYPYTFRKPGQALTGPLDRPGDPRLRERIKDGLGGQHEAILAWLVAGAVRWYQNGRVMPESPRRVQEDTRVWRRDSDVVLEYLEDYLVFEPGSHIACQDLLVHLNAWLESNRHRAWADKLVTSRFGDHDAVRPYVEKARVRRKDTGLSRPPLDPSMDLTPSVPERFWAWTGVRFRTASDDLADTASEPAPTRANVRTGTGGTATPDNPYRVGTFGLTELAVPAVPATQSDADSIDADLFFDPNEF